jgi:hypothetical protein
VVMLTWQLGLARGAVTKCCGVVKIMLIEVY